MYRIRPRPHLDNTLRNIIYRIINGGELPLEHHVRNPAIEVEPEYLNWICNKIARACKPKLDGRAVYGTQPKVRASPRLRMRRYS